MTRLTPWCRTSADALSIAPFEFNSAPLTHGEMRKRSRIDHTGLAAQRSVIRVAPLPSVNGEVGRRTVAVGRTRIVVSGRTNTANEITIVA
jgi:hypothetical protein